MNDLTCLYEKHGLAVTAKPCGCQHFRQTDVQSMISIARRRWNSVLQKTRGQTVDGGDVSVMQKAGENNL